MFPSYSKIVFLDGIQVPISNFTAAWGEGGAIQYNITLMPSFESEHFLPSTQIHIFHLETGKLATERRTYEADPGRVGFLPFEQNFLKTDFVQDAASETVGSRINPLRNTPNRQKVSDDYLKERMKHHGYIFLGGGVVDIPSSSASATQANTVTLQCRGSEVDMDLVQLIQLVGGRGTLTAIERRFFGQNTKREGTAKTLLHGKGRKAYADALSRLLVKEDDFSAGVRSLLAQYPALINDMWLHRFAWNRLSNQISISEGDSSIARLIGTKTFEKYLRNKMQGQYVLPLRESIQAILDFVGYKIFSIPAPAYWPIVPAPLTKEVYEEKVTEQQVKYGVSVIISWGRTVKYDPTSLPSGATGGAVRDADGVWVYNDGRTLQTLSNQVFGAGRTTGVLSEGGTRIDFKLPKTNDKGQLVLGGGSDQIISTKKVKFGLFLQGVTRFEAGKTYRVTGTQGLEAGAGFGADFLPYTRLHFKIKVIRGGQRLRRRTQKIRKELPPDRPDRYYSNTFSRLNTYAILPKLWWAVPPQCNILVPEMILSVQLSKPGLNTVTRTIGRGQPGKGPKAKTRIDKFTAPNVDDLNRALEDAFDDPIDAVNLQKSEYIAGVRAQVLPFGHLTKMASASQWEEYMRTWVVQNHWDTRLEPRTAQITVKACVGLVPGAPCLVIRGTGDESSTSLTPEQSSLLAKLRRLRALRSRLAKVRAGLIAHLRRARKIRQWVRNLKTLSSTLYDENLADQINEEDVSSEGLWQRNGSSLQSMKVGASFDKVRRTGKAELRHRQDASYSDASNLSSGAFAKAASVGVSTNKGELSSASYLNSFKTLLGDKGLEIYPRGKDTIERLPTTDELSAHESSLSRKSGSLGACVAALGEDIALIDREIKNIIAQLRQLGQANQQGRSLLGYVRSIQHVSSPIQKTEQWVLSLSHVRHVGEDLDWDGIAGDDVENTIIFGEDGFLDERYHSENIGKEVYFPTFGSESIVDLPWVQEAFQEYVAAPLDLESASIQRVIEKFRHPDVCGKKHYEDGSSGLLPVKPTISFACQQIIDAYFQVRATGRSEDIFAWVENFQTRPWGTLPDMFRGFPLGWDEDREVATHLPSTEYQPWESDAEVYGFGKEEAAERTVGTLLGEEGHAFAGNPPQGFFSTSIHPPYVTQEGADFTAEEARSQLANIEKYLSYGDELTDNERALLVERQRRVIRYLQTLIDKTSSRRD